ncbi:MAG: hypothetical protein Q4G66_10105 [bacterium]|nr:hypothetical protein [bacterium]
MKKDFEQNAVSAAIWPWANDDAGTSPRGSSCTKGLIPFAIGLCIAALFFYFDRIVFAAVVLALASSIFLGSRVSAAFEKRLDAFMKRFSVVVGTIITWSLLVPFYYVWFGTGRLMQLLRGRDPLMRKLEPELPSYWQDVQENQDPDRYRKQF